MLRSVLLIQKRGYRPIGEILVDEGLVSEEDLALVLNNQLEEDLHTVFTWRSGLFEFYKNKPEDSFILEQIARTPRFDVNAILLEAARRADEWCQILDVIGTVHTIPIIAPMVQFPEMDGDELTIIEAIDHQSSIADLSEVAVCGLFNTARTICNLERKGFIDLSRESLGQTRRL